MIKGVEFSGIESGIKSEGFDLGLVYFQEPVNVFPVYTRNKVKCAHILYDKKIDKLPVRALVVNSGCANACTGKEGIDDFTRIALSLSKKLGVDKDEILFASTGVIGKRLPTDRIIKAIPGLVKSLKPSHLNAFARAIMTTDTHPKITEETFNGKNNYRIVGVAKGSGMINPLFATMLAFVFTDYPVSKTTLRRNFIGAVKESFERITVDGECSTNDTVMLFTKQGDEDTGALPLFREKVLTVMKNLAMMIVKDGEGATRIIHITVNGAKRKEYAEKIARRISISPLTKTAFFGCDPNWGRIIAATGDADVPVNPNKIEIIVQGEVLARNGMEIPFSEEALKKRMNKKEVELVVNLNDGRASYDLYTTDLTYDYIKINASYRT